MAQILRTLISLVGAGTLLSPGLASAGTSPHRPPNIVFIYADDLGYGDTSAYGATSLKTPNVDRLACEGLRFTSAYSSSATCTPSRFSLLTGKYAFRQKGTGILPGDASLIIDPARTTLPSMLKKAGYTTGAVGKWHLGLGTRGETVDWNGTVSPGPAEVGFDYSFIMAATGDRVPCVFLENQRIVGLNTNDPIRVSYSNPFPGEPNGVDERDHLRLNWSHGHNQAVVNGIGRIGYMTGGKSALWKDEDMAETFTRKGVDFIERNHGKPFFLYFATHDIHVPRVPHARFAGKTTMGARGDVILQFDWAVGEILSALVRLKLTEDTLVILTSDNGPVLDDGYKDFAVEKLGNHKPGGPFRGGKYSIFEAGTRIPLIVYWPGRVKAGTSDALFSQVDFVATLAALTSQQLKPGEAPDSRNLLSALLGDSRAGRDHVIEYARTLAVRKANWKYIAPGPGPRRDTGTNTELGNDPKPQLYDLAADPGETNNLAQTHPERLKGLTDLLAAVRDKGSQ